MMEQISALADDEIALADAEHLMAVMQANSHGAEAWSHYHLIGDVMRGAGALSPNFKQNLMQKIELEPTVLSPNAAQLNGGFNQQASSQQPVVKSASTQSKLPAVWSIAASFAAVLVVGYMVLQTQSDFNGTTQATQASLATQDAPMLVSANEQAIPQEYLAAHQASAPTASSYYMQAANYAQ